MSRYIGFDLSTQQLKAIVVDSNLTLVYEAKVDFDVDLPHYGIKKGVLANPSEGQIYAPVAMWLEAIDLVLVRLKEQGLDFGTVGGISGAGMQHGTVFWSHNGEEMLQNLDTNYSLVDQLKGAFSRDFSPNWQDASTQKQCDEFDVALGSKAELANITGSSAHHRFSGPQIMRFRQMEPEAYKATARISLVSSFLASILLGYIAPIDISDVCGMDLWDIQAGKWNDQLLSLVNGGDGQLEELKKKLGSIDEDAGASLGSISSYFVRRYGFPQSCSVIPCTGDNPATILALPLKSSDAIVSLGTSTTFLMSTSHYKPDPSYHFMNHPTTPGLYMFMLCYKNGGLAREQIRDALNDDESDKSWDKFNEIARSTHPLGQTEPKDQSKMGLYFPRPEIVPNVEAGIWRYLHDAHSGDLKQASSHAATWREPIDDVRAIIESQFLSLRLRSQGLVTTQADPTRPQEQLPAQPRRVYLVGGGSANPAIAQICGEVLGGTEGVFQLRIGGNACALGAAYRAVWGCERSSGETFEDLIGERWHEEAFVKRVAPGYKQGVWQKYGEALKGFHQMEQEVLAMAGT